MTISTQTFQARQTEAVIVIRMLPPAEVSPNWHGSWRQKGKAVAEFRAEAAWAVRVAMSDSHLVTAFCGHFAPVVLDFQIAWCCGRKRLDDDNAKAALKAAIDGISDVLWGGQDRHVTIGEVKQIRGQGLVTVTLKGA